MNQGYLSPDFATGLVNTRGLLTAEYLLFYGGTDNACGPSSAMNTNGTWAAIGATELAARKASYAHAVAADVLKRANELADAWDPAKENFVAQLRTAGHGSAVYTSEQMAFNAVSDALFYLEFDVKDAKLGRPAGLQDCTKATCPEALESQFAMRSKEHVRNNLLGFRLLFEGCGPNGEGLGFDDYLYAVGAADLADEMKRELAASLAALDAIEEPDLSEALTTDLESVKALYAAVKKVTDRLKVDFVAVLDLDLPARFEGDND